MQVIGRENAGTTLPPFVLAELSTSAPAFRFFDSISQGFSTSLETGLGICVILRSRVQCSILSVASHFYYNFRNKVGILILRVRHC